MTLNDIIVAALAQLERGSNALNVERYRQPFTAYINEAIIDIAESLKLYRTDTVALVDGKFSGLPYVPTKIIGVYADGVPIPWGYGDADGEYVVDVDAVSVSVRYNYIPKPIKDSADTPPVPEYLHPAIVDYVIACDKGSGDPTVQGGSAIYFQRYQLMKSKLTKGRRTKIRNYY